MLRMMLWSLIPLGIAVAIGGAVMGAMGKGDAHAILASEADAAGRNGMIIAGIVFVLLHATVEAGRGWLGADRNLRSVIRAWWRGVKLLVRRPFATLLVYVVASLVGYGLAVGNRLYFRAAAAMFAIWLAVVGWRGYLWLRQAVAGLDLIAGGLASFVVAALISLRKAGVSVSQALRLKQPQNEL